MRFRPLLPKSEREALRRHRERINAPWRPELPARPVDPRCPQLQQMINQVSKKIGLLQALRSTLLDAIDDPLPFDRVDRLLGCYTSEHADLFVGLDAAELAAIITDWQDDNEN